MAHTLEFLPKAEATRRDPAMDQVAVPEYYSNQWQEMLDLASTVLEIPACTLFKIENDTPRVFKASRSPSNPFKENDLPTGQEAFFDRIVAGGEPFKISDFTVPGGNSAGELLAPMTICWSLSLVWPNGKPFGAFCVMQESDSPFSPVARKLLLQYQQIIKDHLTFISNQDNLNQLIERQFQTQLDLGVANKQLQIVQGLQSQYISSGNNKVVFDNLLDNILSFTDSRFGFIAEYINEDPPYIKAHAITNASWNKETEALYQKNYLTGFKFYNFDTLFGEVITTQQPLISNNVARDMEDFVLPEGYPPLNSFLGIPLFFAGELVGMAGMANREGGYDEKIIDQLQPILNACGNVMNSIRREELRLKAEKTLFENREELGTILDSSPAFIIFKDLDRNIVKVNQQVADFMGQAKDEIEGRHSDEIFSKNSEKYFLEDQEVFASGKPKLGIVEPYPLKGDREIWVRTDRVSHPRSGGQSPWLDFIFGGYYGNERGPR